MRKGLRLCLVGAGFIVAALAPASASAGGITYGDLGLAYEQTTTNFPSPPQRQTQSSYHPCIGEGMRFLSAGGYLEANPTFNFGEAHFASLYPVDQVDPKGPDSTREVVDNTSSNTDITIGERTVCGDLEPSYERSSKRSHARRRTKAKVSCAGGEHVIGGGGKTSGKFKSQRLVATAPFDGDDANEDPDDGWRIAVDNTTKKDLRITAYATCADVDGLSYVVGAFSADPMARQDESTSCPGGQYVIGGGLTADGPFKKEKLVGSRPLANHDGWDIAVDNLTGDFLNGHVFAICHT